MDLSPILNPLNDEQRAAVTAPLGPVLVLAGAGSGKTRVLTHRIAWVIQAEGASPHNILAVTFTNKAAAEMRGRVERLLGVPSGALWIGTFHGLAHRLLRIHWREAKLVQGFQIIDSEDQQRLVKKLIRAADLDETRWIAREVQWFINGNKDEGRRPQHLKDGNDPTRMQLIRLYASYEQACARAGAVDFAELLLRAYELWRDNPELLAHYRRRFQHVLVDEFQDTNGIQYEWLRLIAPGTPDAQGSASYPFVVGDDDQSVYRFRGARVANLQEFRRDYNGAQLFRLEQNYRSTANILAGANGLIAHNNSRLGKNLWTNGEQGEPIRLYTAFNERDEAEFVTHRIREHVAQGGLRREVAILYRSNAQSRVFEEAFLSARVPYRVYGGLRFFERQEIKDALAYLRLIANRRDDASFERVVNLPPRKVGAKSLDVLRDYARANGTSLWDSAAAAIAAGTLGNAAAMAVHDQHEHDVLQRGLADGHRAGQAVQDADLHRLGLRLRRCGGHAHQARHRHRREAGAPKPLQQNHSQSPRKVARSRCAPSVLQHACHSAAPPYGNVMDKNRALRSARFGVGWRAVGQWSDTHPSTLPGRLARWNPHPTGLRITLSVFAVDPWLPPASLALLALLALLLWRRGGRALALLLLAPLVLLSMPIVSLPLLASLDPKESEPGQGMPPGAIVILSADVDRTDVGGLTSIGALTLERERAGAALQRATGLPVLVTGGLVTAPPPVGALMAASMQADFNVPVRWAEVRSATTWENAAFSVPMLRDAGVERVYLVTHAWHMRRSLLAFRRAGMPAVPAVVRRDPWPRGTMAELMPRTSSWERSYYALHEWFGLLYYQWRS